MRACPPKYAASSLSTAAFARPRVGGAVTLTWYSSSPIGSTRFSRALAFTVTRILTALIPRPPCVGVTNGGVDASSIPPHPYQKDVDVLIKGVSASRRHLDSDPSVSSGLERRTGHALEGMEDTLWSLAPSTFECVDRIVFNQQRPSDMV